MSTQQRDTMPSTDPLGAGWEDLRDRGLLTGDAFRDRAEELAAVRAVAGTSLALGRVFDGHRNAVERLLRHRPQDVGSDERAAIAAARLALGVWGADPAPGDGAPAVLGHGPGGPVITGAKAFCSGAGLLDQAIVLVRRTPDGPPILPVLVDLRAIGTVEIDREWFVGSALRESRSDLVTFTGAPVLAVLGEEGSLSEDPWISGDALRSSAVWAGGVDTIVRRVVAHVAARDPGDADLERLGRIDAARATVDTWLAAALTAVERAHDGGPTPASAVAAMRLELTARIRAVIADAAELTGSRGLVADAELAAAREGLDVLLLQHRLGPVAQRRGRALVTGAVA